MLTPAAAGRLQTAKKETHSVSDDRSQQRLQPLLLACSHSGHARRRSPCRRMQKPRLPPPRRRRQKRGRPERRQYTRCGWRGCERLHWKHAAPPRCLAASAPAGMSIVQPVLRGRRPAGEHLCGHPQGHKWRPFVTNSDPVRVACRIHHVWPDGCHSECCFAICRRRSIWQAGEHTQPASSRTSFQSAASFIHGDVTQLLVLQNIVMQSLILLIVVFARVASRYLYRILHKLLSCCQI